MVLSDLHDIEQDLEKRESTPADQGIAVPINF